MALSIVTRGFKIGSIARVVLRGYFAGAAVVVVGHKTLTLNPRVLTMTTPTRSLTLTLNPRVLTLTTPEE